MPLPYSYRLTERMEKLRRLSKNQLEIRGRNIVVPEVVPTETPIPTSTLIPTPTPSPTNTPTATPPELLTFLYKITGLESNLSQKVAFNANAFLDTLYFNELPLSGGEIKTMSVYVDNIGRSLVEFTSPRLGTIFGYKLKESTTSIILTGAFVAGEIDLSRSSALPTPTPTATLPPTPTPTPTSAINPQGPVYPLYVTNNNQIINIPQNEQRYIFVDNDVVSRFTITINNVDGSTLINNYDSQLLSNCSLAIATTKKFDCSTDELFVTNQAILSSVKNELYTLYYYSTGAPLILGISPTSIPLSYNPNNILEGPDVWDDDQIWIDSRIWNEKDSRGIWNDEFYWIDTKQWNESSSISLWDDNDMWTDCKIWKDINLR